MTDRALRDLVAARWKGLDAEPVSAEHRLRVVELPVTTINGPVLAAVDLDGHRHLLVPMKSRQTIRQSGDGAVLRLRKRVLEDEEGRQSYADLSCARRDLDDICTTLCTDVLTRVKTLPDNPIRALNDELERWRSLFRARSAPLGPDKLAALAGELTALVRLLEHDPSAHRLWLGPDGHRHDFANGHRALEIKATTSTEGRRPRIHGLDQLEAPDGGSLHLAWFRLERSTESGVRFLDLVNEARHLCDSESALLGLLARAGYHPLDDDSYRDVRFLTTEERWYLVDEHFPGLTGRELADAGIVVSAQNVEYTIDLSGNTPPALDADEAETVLNSLIQESA